MASAGPLEDGFAAAERGDYVTALRLWRPLADQGDKVAQFNLATLYYYGQGMPLDYVEAAKWLRMAADQGLGLAQILLGLCYASGDGVPEDYVTAHMWLNLGISRTPAGSQRDAVIANFGQLNDRMTKAQIAEAQKLAHDWKPK